MVGGQPGSQFHKLVFHCKRLRKKDEDQNWILVFSYSEQVSQKGYFIWGVHI